MIAKGNTDVFPSPMFSVDADPVVKTEPRINNDYIKCPDIVFHESILLGIVFHVASSLYPSWVGRQVTCRLSAILIHTGGSMNYKQLGYYYGSESPFKQ
jgi:hypothetical protein